MPRRSPIDLDDDGPLPGSLAAALDAGAPWSTCSRGRRTRPGPRSPTPAPTPSRTSCVRRPRWSSRTTRRARSPPPRWSASPTGCPAGPCTSAATRSPSAPTCGSPRSAARRGSSTRSCSAATSGRAGAAGCCSTCCSTCSPQPASQAAVTDARDAYAQRRAALVEALAGHGITVRGRDGLNIWLPVADETAALLRLASAGIGATAGAPFAVRRDARPYLRITTGLLAEGYDRVAAELAAAARAGSWAGAR